MRVFRISLGALAAVGLFACWVASASADVTFSTDSGSATWSAIPGVPVYTSDANPAANTTNQTNNGQAAPTGATAYALAETFTPSSSFTLGAVVIPTGGMG